jgi:hypothetical protein
MDGYGVYQKDPGKQFIYKRFNSYLLRNSCYVVSGLIRRRFLRDPQWLLADSLPVAGDRNNPTVERVTVPSDFDFIEQVNSASGTIGRNPDLDAAIMWHVILVNGSCGYLHGVLFWSVCDNADQLLGLRNNGRKTICTTRQR